MAFVCLNNLSVFLLMYVSINFVIGSCEYTCAFAYIAFQWFFLALHCFFVSVYFLAFVKT